MFRDRLFLTGLGIGLIAGALLLQLMNVALDAREAVQMSNPEDGDGTVQQALETSPTPGISASVQDDESGNKPEQTSPAPTAILPVVTKSAEPAPNVSSAIPETTSNTYEGQVDSGISVSVYGGMSSEEVVGQLARAGVISDQQALLEAIYAYKVQTKIRTGTYIIPKDAEHSEIIAIITKQKQ